MQTNPTGERVWYSRIRSDDASYRSFNFSMGQSAMSKIDFVEGVTRHNFVDPSAAAEYLFFQSHRDIKKTHKHAFFINDHLLIVSSEMRDLLMTFDIGDAQFFKVPIRLEDGLGQSTYLDHYILNVHDKKRAFVPEHSEEIKWSYDKDDGQGGKISVWFCMYKKDILAVSKAALEGLDLWAEDAVPSRLFFSDRLKRALDEAGMNKSSFRLVEARVV